MGKVEKLKKRIYEIIEISRDNDKASKAYDTMVLIAIVVGMIPLTMKMGNTYTKYIDIIVSIIFVLDYLLRLYTADYKMGYKHYKSYIAYAMTPMAIIDLLSIVPVLTFVLPWTVFIGMFRILRILRILRMFRVLKLIRYSKTVMTIYHVVKKVKSQLFAVLLLTLVYICVTAMVIFQVEPELFETFFDAIYWATISITTVGYGDISPKTDMGRLMTILSSLVGVAVIALPSGIITAAYMDEVKRSKTKWEL